jgi:hypothetical protein
MPKSDSNSTLNTVGTLGALGVLGAGGYAGYKYYKKKQREERKKAAIRNAILGTTGAGLAAGGAYGGLKYLQHRNAKDLANFKNLALVSNLDNISDNLAKNSIPLGVDPIVPKNDIDAALQGLHPKPEPTFKVMGVPVEPTNVTTGTVSYGGNVGKVPNPAGGPTIQLSSDPRIRTQQMDDIIATLEAKRQPQGREFYSEINGAHSQDNRKLRRRKKQLRSKSPEVQARREARKAKELAHRQRMAEQSRLHTLETKNLKSGKKAVKQLINAGIPPRDAVDLVVNAKKPGGAGVGFVSDATKQFLKKQKPGKKVRIPGRSGAKLNGKARAQAFKAGKKVLNAIV